MALGAQRRELMRLVTRRGLLLAFAGAALTGFVALYYLGLTSTIYTAAFLKIGVSAAVWRALRTEHV